ncbi:EEF1A lysine methyltransferase 3-like [Pristis pectinata]|uniref:EEF1A lysine methyltransferase 3-like n=1 Tax=Pristis pectinata TaxID=685728 RepID=UPI00223D08EF|nr:EEF1A lysine methyltransferase 3-like [Pristis pectinata]
MACSSSWILWFHSMVGPSTLPQGTPAVMFFDFRRHDHLPLREVTDSPSGQLQRNIGQDDDSPESPNNSADNEPKEERYSRSSYITYSNFQFCGYRLKIARIMDDNMGVSAYVWEAGIALCRYFEKEDINFTGKKVIELGSGTGTVGILATLLGGEVTMTDKPNILKQIENNVSINIPSACRHRVKVRALTWGEDHTSFPTDYDFILGSDIVYSSLSYPALMETLRYLANQGATIYLSSELRARNRSSSFHEEVLPQHFKCQVADKLEDKDIVVYKMTKICTILHEPPKTSSRGFWQKECGRRWMLAALVERRRVVQWRHSFLSSTRAVACSRLPRLCTAPRMTEYTGGQTFGSSLDQFSPGTSE